MAEENNNDGLYDENGKIQIPSFLKKQRTAAAAELSENATGKQEIIDLIDSIQVKRDEFNAQIDEYGGHDKALKTLNGRKGALSGHLKRANKKIEAGNLDEKTKADIEAKIADYETRIAQAEEERVAKVAFYDALRDSVAQNRIELEEREEKLKALLEKFGVPKTMANMSNLAGLRDKIENSEFPTNALSQAKTLNKLPDLETLLLDARKFDSNKDKEFLDESMRTSNAAQTAAFNAPAAGVFIPPKIQLLKDVFSKMRVVVPAIGGFLLGMATPALAAKIFCTTALTPIVPFAAPIVGFVVGAGYNLRKDYVANKAADQSFKFRELLTDKKALGKAFGAGAVGAGASLLGGFAFGELFGEAACGATETVSPEPAPVVDAPMPEPQPEPPAAPEFNILTSDDIIDAGDLLDLQQNDMKFLDKLIEAGYANGVDSSIIDALRVQLEGGFDFIDSTASAEAMNVYNSMLEGAMDASSEAGSSITSGEYTSILSSFMDKLTDPDIYKTDTAGVVDDSYLPSSIRESIINQAQTLRAAIS